MRDAINFISIIENMNEKFQSMPLRVVVFDSIDPISQNAMAEINSKIKKHSLIGVLFCNPDTEFCKKEILNSLNYFHHRSGEKIDFFCCGYGEYWPEKHYADQKAVVTINGSTWSYSDQALINVIEGFERHTKWEYSGENELLLLDISPPKSNEILQINNAIVCNLESMKRDNAFTSVRAFFEDIIRYAASDECASAWKYSDKKALNIVTKTLKDSILGFLPKTLQQSYKEAENYVIRQI